MEKNRVPQPVSNEETKIDNKQAQTITIGEKTEEFLTITNYSWDQEGKKMLRYTCHFKILEK